MAVQYDQTNASTDHESVTDQLKRGRDEFRDVRSEFLSLFDDLRVLGQKEVELAKAEMKEQVGLARNTIIFGAAAAILGLMLLSFAFVSVMFALDLVMPLWAAALITTGIIAAITLIIAMMLMSSVKRITIVPSRTMNSVNEDVQWAKRQMSLNAK